MILIIVFFFASQTVKSFFIHRLIIGILESIILIKNNKLLFACMYLKIVLTTGPNELLFYG